MNEIGNITQLSTSTAMDMFRIKILPVLTYGQEMMGEYLAYKQIAELERVKARYVKRMFCRSPTKLKIEASIPTYYGDLIEDLRCKLILPSSTDYKQLMQDLHEMKNNILYDFNTSAMQDRT